MKPIISVVSGVQICLGCGRIWKPCLKPPFKHLTEWTNRTGCFYLPVDVNHADLITKKRHIHLSAASWKSSAAVGCRTGGNGTLLKDSGSDGNRKRSDGFTGTGLMLGAPPSTSGLHTWVHSTVYQPFSYNTSLCEQREFNAFQLMKENQTAGVTCGLKQNVIWAVLLLN